jgi:hypothetical protein
MPVATIGEAGTPGSNGECQLATKHLKKVCGGATTRDGAGSSGRNTNWANIPRSSYVGTSATSFSVGSDVTHSDARSDAA